MKICFVLGLFAIKVVSASFICPNVEVVPREIWKAKTPKYDLHLQTPMRHVFIGHTVTPACRSLEQCSYEMRSMQNYHMIQLGWYDIAYNFVIGGDGRAYEGTGWERPGLHTLGFNDKSIGIGFVGNFMAQKPSEVMLDAAKQLIICGIQAGFVTMDREVHGSRDGTCTLSPGDELYRAIKQWPRFVGGRLPGYTCPK